MLILSFMLPQLEVCQVRSPGDLLSALFRFQASPRYLDFHSASHGQIDDAPSHPANVNMILFGFFDWIFCIETRIRIYHLAELDWLLCTSSSTHARLTTVPDFSCISSKSSLSLTDEPV